MSTSLPPASATRRRYDVYPDPITLLVKLVDGRVYRCNVSDATIEGAALLLWSVDPRTLWAELVTAFAPGQWRQVEPAEGGFNDATDLDWDESPAIPIKLPPITEDAAVPATPAGPTPAPPTFA